MRNCFLFVVLATFGATLAAQPTPGFSIDIIVHEPTASQVGTHIENLHLNSDPRTENPNYDPDQPTGEAPFNPAYGNGKGFHNELDRVSGEFYAIGGTTTHDLAILTNNSGGSVTLDYQSTAINGSWYDVSSRPKVNPDSAPEQNWPDGGARVEMFEITPTDLVVDDGSSVAAFMLRIKWADRLDTSPRNYILTFVLALQGGGDITVEGDLLVPPVGGSNPTGCASSPNGFPHGLWLIAGGAIAAYTTRRKLLARA